MTPSPLRLDHTGQWRLVDSEADVEMPVERQEGKVTVYAMTGYRAVHLGRPATAQEINAWRWA